MNKIKIKEYSESKGGVNDIRPSTERPKPQGMKPNNKKNMNKNNKINDLCEIWKTSKMSGLVFIPVILKKEWANEQKL